MDLEIAVANLDEDLKAAAKSIVKMLNEKNKEKVLDDAANLAVSLDNLTRQRTIHTKTAPYKVSRLAEQHKRFTLTILG